METPFRFRPNQPVSWFSANKRRSNQHCLYCGAFVGVGSTVPSNREHLVARNFVPPRTLDAVAFNFIFRACAACNALKADAERHVSSVTLLNSQARADNPAVDALAEHKGQSDYHPELPGVRVADASISRTITGSFGPANFSFGLIGPPQLERHRAAILACNQIQALFSLVTTRDACDGDQTVLLRAAFWHYLGMYSWHDWGNAQLVELSRRVSDWPIIARITTAHGYFRAILRATDSSPDDWFWGLEWNRSVRVVGTLYRGDQVPDAFQDLPELNWRQVGPNTRMHEETPESPGRDHLFGE